MKSVGRSAYGLMLVAVLLAWAALGLWQTFPAKAQERTHCTICDCCEEHCMKPEMGR